MTVWQGWNVLLSIPPPWAHLVRAGARETEGALRADPPENVGVVLRLIRGERCGTKQGLLREWGAALQFPYYFGENWDAFEECINDLEWLPARSYLVAVTRADQVARNTQDFTTLIQILDTAAARWAAGGAAGMDRMSLPVSFHVVFSCEPEGEAALRDCFAATGIALHTLLLPTQ